MRAVIAAALLAGAAAMPASAVVTVGGNPALYWSSLVTSTLTGSPIATSRTAAMAQLAIFEAANATTGQRYSSYLNSGAVGGDTRAAIAVAAHGVLVSVNPARTGDYNTALADALALIPDGAAKVQGMATGAAIAAATIANRAGDGFNLVVPYSPQSPETPGAYQLTPPGFPPPAGAQLPGVTPWVMTSGDQFRALPPPALDSAQYAADFNEVKDWGATSSLLRTADQSNAAVVWASTAGGATWANVAIALADGAGMSTEDAARMMAILAIGNADTFISVWDSKYHYDFWRPITAIRNADIDGNNATLMDAGWSSLLTTPPYPSHSSGISGVAGNAVAVLESFFGDANAFCISGTAGQRCFNSLAAGAMEGAESRIYGGIHFRFELTEGLAQGRSVGNLTRASLFTPVPEPQTWAMLILGFGLLGASLRRHKRPALRYLTA
jgi:hypothetical protein